MSKRIAKLMGRSNAANKLVDAVLDERIKPGSQAIRIVSGTTAKSYRPIGYRSKDLKEQELA
ncbi:hypothetical protein [Cesiribacter sp. SM1]|uniref:hypothetical protein n=1 Tax=Cesiribacter sp. SM1 TaxID=2861196 RepID=UPI001CD2C722|nr:hypothetical protein [Cesiribacter sp. SM1]